MSRVIAALDQSGGSTPSALDRYGVEYTEHNMMEKIHAMRLRMVNSPDFNDKNIWAAILYQDTVTRGMVNILDEKGIDTFLKIDEGLATDGTMKPFDVNAICEWATNGVGPKIYGTKMRSVVNRKDLIKLVLKQQFTIAQTVSEYGLVPIIEPEVPIDHPDKESIEQKLYNQLELYLSGINFKVILKLTPPEVPNLYHNLTVHHNVEKVVFLSGGYPTMEACRRLKANADVIASFSRALSEGLNYNLTDKEFNAKMKQNIKQITEASK
jgi:fructose-bisphosphate aldolase class I